MANKKTITTKSIKPKTASKKTTKKTDRFNGVTTKWLIDLFDRFKDDSWVHTFQYSTLEGFDQIYVCFKDFSGDEWVAIIHEINKNKVVELKLSIGGSEPWQESYGYVKYIDFMKYLDSLPKTTYQYFKSKFEDIKGLTLSNDQSKLILGNIDPVVIQNLILELDIFKTKLSDIKTKIAADVTSINKFDYDEIISIVKDVNEEISKVKDNIEDFTGSVRRKL